SQTRATFAAAVRILVPSGLKLSAATVPVCPWSVWRSRPSVTFQSLTALSAPPLARTVESRLNATSVAPPRCASSDRSSRPVRAGTCDEASVWTERDGRDPARMANDEGHVGLRARIPEACGSVVARGHDPGAVGAERRVLDPVAVTREGRLERAG